MIGRNADVRDLLYIVREEGTSVLMDDERRFGKTSVALAVLDLLRQDDRVALDCDLTSPDVRSSAALAERLAAQARLVGVGVMPQSSAGRRAGRVLRERIASGKAAEVARALGVDGAEDLLNAIGAALGPAGPEIPLRLHDVLGALGDHAALTGEKVVIFVDELQALAQRRLWKDKDDAAEAERALAAAASAGGVVLCLAGSHRTLTKKFFEKGRPLGAIGARFSLQPIPFDIWSPALTARFVEAGVTCDAKAGHAIWLAADSGHPRKTMHVCHHAVRWARGNADRVDEQVVANAAAEARKHGSWN